REGLWQEPIYRNVWSLLREFSDAEVASLIAPRALVIEAAAAPESTGPPAVKPDRRGGASPAKLATPRPEAVERAFRRAAGLYKQLNQAHRLAIVATSDGKGPAGSTPALSAFLKGLGVAEPARMADAVLRDVRENFDPQERQKRQFDELVEFT